jgi:hypothetical protein
MEDRTRTIRERPANESFLARQWRLLIKADFRSSESVALNHGDNSLDSYLSGGPASRFFCRLWNLLVATSGLAFLAALVVILAGNSTFSWWEAPFACVGCMAMCYFGWYHFAGWRSMRRHRKAGR